MTTTTTTAGDSSSEGRGGFGEFGKKKSFPCDACGAQLTFSIDAQKLKCEHCGAEKDLDVEAGAAIATENDLMAALDGQSQRRQSDGRFAGQEELKCTGCGATVVFSGSLTSSECSYCGGAIQREDAHKLEHRLTVDGLLTFLVDKATAEQKLKSWVKSRWFAPNEFKRRGAEGKFDGVYMPFFTFDAMTSTSYRGERGDAYTVTEGSGENKRTVRKVRWSHASGHFRRFFDDVLIPALQSLPQPLLRRLEPWPLEQLMPFTDQALAGKRAHTYELELRDCFHHAKEVMEDALRGDVRRRIGGDEQRIHSVDTTFTALTYKHVLLPVWILAYKFQDKSYRVVVNATTGQVSGERPWSPIKIALASIAAAIVVGVVVYLTRER